MGSIRAAGCTEETLIIQGTRARARARTQHFAMSGSVASALTFALLRPKEQKEEDRAHACTHTYSLLHWQCFLSALHLSPPKDIASSSSPVPGALLTLSVFYIGDQ